MTTQSQSKTQPTRASAKHISVMALAFASGLGISLASHAEPTGYDQLSFSTEVSHEVSNDEVQASLYKKAQAKTAKDLAVQLNTVINQAMTTAKRYPSVTVSTGQQNTYPRYDKNDKIIGWTGQAYIQVKSTDMDAASQLIAELQDSLVMGSINFGVSNQRQTEIETQLKAHASKAFQEQANSLAHTWGASGYRLVDVSFTTNGHYQPMAMGRMYAVAEAQATPAPAQNFESGNSSISVTANGKIELVR